MGKYIKRLFLSIMMLMLFQFCGNYEYNSASADESSKKHTIWVIGDSTVSAFNDNYYYPRYGYGTQLGEYIDYDIYDVKNLALSGRSSKSYVLDSEYQILLSGMNEGDFLIIGFGHNDEKFEEERYTNPNGTYEDEGSFANSIYKNYIEPAEEKGCKTILCTPIVRRTATGDWIDSELHITSTSGNYEGGDYPQAIRDLGDDLAIPVVDITALTKKVYDELGVDETLYLHAWTSSKPASVDNTHTNIWGGKYNAYLVAKAIKELDIKDISSAVLEDKIKEAPSKDENLYSNHEYKEPEYDSNLKQSELWSDAGIWKGSVFGNIGSAPDNFGFTLTAQDMVNVNMAVKNNKGKIASAGDGIAMYYYKIPSNSTFTLSATATINSITNDNQVSFGLMARDDMYIDTVIGNLNTDYVVAGPLNIAKESPWNCFARKSGILTQGGTVTNTVFEAGQSIDLKIQSNSDGYACTMGNEETITGGFDFAITSIDPDYVYVGMFVARNVDISFSNIKLIIDGEEIK